MKILTSENLKKLASIYSQSGANLYIVGGYVRNAIMGFYNTDCDIAGKLTLEELSPLLKDTPFDAVFQDKKTGTVIIKCSDEVFEYTPFRGEIYDEDGCHRPKSVKFNVSLTEDAKRRDFTINAIYYDILNEKTVDPLNGIKDINSRIIRAVTTPEQVMSNDGLRILRLIRIAAELGFNIEKDLFKTAEEKVNMLKAISAERIKKELDKILVADTKYPGMTENAHVTGLCLLDKLNVLGLLFPELLNLKGLKQPEKYHEYDAFEHTKEVFKYSAPDIRLAALLHDIGKAESIKLYHNMHFHAELGAKIALKYLTALKYSNSEKRETVALIKNHDYDIDGNTKESKLRLFIVKNYDIINKLIELKKADGMGKGKKLEGVDISKKWYELLNRMKSDNTPFKLSDLKVNGIDILNLRPDIEKTYIKIILENLFKEAVMNPRLNEREKLVNRIKEYKIDKEKI